MGRRTPSSKPRCRQEESNSRQRKTHRKSRLGCRNCKLRRIKCDETTPSCEKCLDFGVTCNYDSSVPDLQPRSGSTEGIEIDSTLEKHSPATGSYVLDMVNIYLSENQGPTAANEGLLRLDLSGMERLERFNKRTVLTMGTKATPKCFRTAMVQLACIHPCVMHLVQSMTAAHDRFCAVSATSRQTTDEIYHLHRGISGMHQKLSRGIRPEDRDALFIAASILGVMMFFQIEASSVENVWPLGAGDFAWVGMSDGKKAVWRATNPLRQDSMWRAVAESYEMHFRFTEKEPTNMISVFDHLCTNSSSPPAVANPYHKTAQFLITLLALELNDTTWMRFLVFICHVDPPFRALIERKDPWALLMLVYWFMKICRGPWWVSTRAILQGQAICIYLERYHADDVLLQKAIPRPKLEFEEAEREGWGGYAFVGRSSPITV
ncbi:hypothetical protein EDD37DRAFT_642349 [Exophiala viscosa]|uniref:Zn(2)-C6 fungal-type domain-containing protein n=1 Tax=Exophiala viscosa TaxID=2486360 RepID=A0AAN6DLP4_9EURO|nr:hypothetical protein EDD36DRAFT_87784 [Exophiala viscosa]KAI1619828.1 hypothetical protein EDD37DRAFT_642349 [Exophiala viscosa]